MTAHDILDITSQGAMLAVVVRWLFHLDVELHWAVCISAASLLLQPWLSLHFGPLVAVNALPDVLMGAAVALALIGIAQVLSSH